MKREIIVAFLLALCINESTQQQNLCGAEALFVPDPADCSLYLFCRRDPQMAVLSVHQIACPNTNPFFKGAENTCTQDNSHCADPLLLCPAFDEPDIMIADPRDSECRRFRLCRMSGMPYLSCPEGLVFNRNTGTCGSSERAPCNPLTIPPECPPNSNGFFPGQSCFHYIFCFNGVLTSEFHCEPGFKFDDVNNTGCVRDTTNSCPQASSLYMIPRVKNQGHRSSANIGMREFFRQFVVKQ